MEAEAVLVITVEAAAEFIYRYIVCCFGCSDKLVSDQGKEFLNQTVRNLNKVMLTKYRFIILYYLQCNGLAESSNKVLIKVFFKLVFIRGSVWDYYFQVILWVFRIKVKVFFDCFFFNFVYGCKVQLFLYVQRESVEYICVNKMMSEFEVLE